MSGGKIIEIAEQPSHNRVRLWCLSARRPHDETAVYIAPGGQFPVIGDTVWWQAGKVYWTPADRRFVDKPLQKVGYSTSMD